MSETFWQPGDTIPKGFLRASRSAPNRVALRHKRLGIWQEYRWQDYLDAVTQAFYGLQQLGARQGDTVAIVSGVSPICFFIDMAALCTRMISVPLPANCTTEELAHACHLAGTRFVICGDQQQLDNVLEIVDRSPTIYRIILINPRGTSDYDDQRIVLLDDLLAIGAKSAADDPESSALRSSIASGEPQDYATISFSSGSTGQPKAAVHTHHNAIVAAETLMETLGVRPSDEYLSFSPMVGVERSAAQVIPLMVHNRVNIVEKSEPDVVRRNLTEVQPTHLIQIPRGWENIANSIRVGSDDAGWLKRTAFRRFIASARKRAELKLAGKPAGWWLRFTTWLGDWLVFRSVRGRVGFSFLRSGVVAGAPIGPDLITFFHAIGVPLRQMYGLTECQLIAVHPVDKVRLESVGTPVPGAEVRIGSAGEIVVRGDALFAEYLRQPEETTAAKGDGWMHTGDMGYFDAEGQLVVIGRQEELFRHADGTILSPTAIENHIKFSPYIREAVVLGQDRGFLSALIQIDIETVGKWARRCGIAYTTFRDLTTKRPVYELIESELAALNRLLEPGSRVERFVLLPKELDVDEGELTRSLRVKRSIVVEKFRDLWLPLYSKDTVTAGS